jgi:2'-5' RNA ligase
VRLFAAVDLSPHTRAEIAAEQKRIAAVLGRAGRSLKWVRADRAHLTLVFLGPVDAARVPPLVEAIEPDIHVRPFDIVFGGIGVFPLRGSPRVLWAGVAEGADELGAIQREVAARVAAHGVTIEARDFHPHLTLARWTSSRPSDRARALSAERSAALASETVARVTLFESRLSASGAEYRALAHANLTGA